MLALGNARLAADEVPRAIGDFERVLRLATGDTAPEQAALAEAHFRLGETWSAMDETARAARHFRASQQNDPADRRGAAIRLAEMDAGRSAETRQRRLCGRCSTVMRRATTRMMTGALPIADRETLRAAAEAAGLPVDGRYAAIDLGCGTGLSGAAFRLLPVAHRRRSQPAHDGGRAGRRPLRTIVTGDLLTALADGAAARFDLAIACDTLIYLGDLAPFFSCLAAALARGGWFVFSTEKSEAADAGYEIGPARRFRHTELICAKWLKRMASRLCRSASRHSAPKAATGGKFRSARCGGCDDLQTGFMGFRHAESPLFCRIFAGVLLMLRIFALAVWMAFGAAAGERAGHLRGGRSAGDMPGRFRL